MLFVVLLGGKHPRARIEVHDVAFVTGATLAETHADLRAGWFGTPDSLHIDSWLEVDGVEGYRITFSHLTPGEGEPRLFFVNLGGYEDGVFGEAHRYRLLVAPDVATARARAKALAPSVWEQGHVDALFDLDDCVPVDRVGGHHVHLVPGAHRPVVAKSDYIRLT